VEVDEVLFKAKTGTKVDASRDAFVLLCFMIVARAGIRVACYRPLTRQQIC
jgi:hypothetical protein